MKKSVKAGVLRRSRTTRSWAFLSSAAVIARDTSSGMPPAAFFLRDAAGAFAAGAFAAAFLAALTVFSVRGVSSLPLVRLRSILAMCNRSAVVQPVLPNMRFHASRHHADQRSTGRNLLPDLCGRHAR